MRGFLLTALMLLVFSSPVFAYYMYGHNFEEYDYSDHYAPVYHPTEPQGYGYYYASSTYYPPAGGYYYYGAPYYYGSPYYYDYPYYYDNYYPYGQCVGCYYSYPVYRYYGYGLAFTIEPYFYDYLYGDYIFRTKYYN